MSTSLITTKGMYLAINILAIIVGFLTVFHHHVANMGIAHWDSLVTFKYSCLKSQSFHLSCSITLCNGIYVVIQEFGNRFLPYCLNGVPQERCRLEEILIWQFS